MFIIWRQQEQFNVSGLYVADILLANSDELNLILPKFARPLHFFSQQAFCHFDKWILLEKMVNIFAF